MNLTFFVGDDNLTTMSRLSCALLLALIFSACATHPTVSPLPLEVGETYLGFTLSTENGMPLVFYRRGLTDKWDVGLRVGLPVYGTGIDVSRVLAQQEDRTDVLNISYSLNPNHNVDYTYYRIKRKRKTNEKKGVTTQKLRYYGLRGMLIFDGITGRRSQRFGVLIGGAPAIKAADAESLPRFYRWQWEIGYFHDFSSMPLKAVIDPRAFNSSSKHWEERFADFPHTANGFPTEYSRLTGLSFRISFPIGASAHKRPKEEESGE